MQNEIANKRKLDFSTSYVKWNASLQHLFFLIKVHGSEKYIWLVETYLANLLLKLFFEWALPDCLLVKVLWRKLPSRDLTESSPNLGLSRGASPVLSGGGGFNFADDVADWTDRFSWSVTHRKKRDWSGAAAEKGSKTSQQRKRESGSGGKAKTTSRTAAT